MRSVEVCFSPLSYPIFKNNDAIVVVIDILRATSAICTAFEHGVKSIIPVASVEEAIEYKNNGYLAAAERHGEVVPGFELGNSPYSYMGENIKDKTVVLTTTNGTQAIEIARDAHQVVIGSFLNIDAITQWLIAQDRDVVLLCSGWKNRFNLEDTLFAGAVAHDLLETGLFENACDTAQAAYHLYVSAKDDTYAFLENSSHRKRLQNLNLERDVRYCLQKNITNVIPVLKGKELVKLQK
jgi:2-phosphosulfolactate phosphatase